MLELQENFTLGRVSVGQVWPTNLYGDVEIISKVSSNSFIGRFVNTGFVTKPSQARAFYSGVITDNAAKSDLSQYDSGSWTILSEVAPLIQPSGITKRRLMCRCVCGEVRNITLDSLSRGVSTNCGCISRETNPRFHGDAGSRLHQCWANMKARCVKRGDSCNYQDSWDVYTNFRDWSLQNGYNDSLILLRGTEDNPDTGDYEEGNCRWGTKRDNYDDWKLAKSIQTEEVE